MDTSLREGPVPAARCARMASVLLAAAAIAGPATPAQTAGNDDPAAMIALFEEFLDWRDPEPGPDGLTDYSSAAVDRRRAGLQRFQQRLETMDITDWTRAQQVEFLAARSHMDREAFTLYVTQPWKRDPVFYVDRIQRVAFTELPVRGNELEELRASLQAIPALVETAQANLTDVAGDFALRALFNLTRSDGVGADQPYRAVPPQGTIGWYGDLLDRAHRQQPELVEHIELARDAVRSFHGWLEDNRARFTAQNGVGEELLDWFIWNVEYLPYTSEEMLRLAHRELQRTRSFLVLERHSNRELPQIELPGSADEYHERLTIADRRIRRWIDEQDVISVPDYIPTTWQDAAGDNVPFILRPEGPNFWEHVQFREPTPDHLHFVIPGHRYDTDVQERLWGDHPIRNITYGSRYQGWALYLEEMSIPAGLLDAEPRVRELIYVFSLWRAARTIGDIHNQRNDWTVRETHDFWIESTPWMDEGVAHRYSHLRASPGHGLEYTIGMIEMYRLLSDRAQQLGEDFVLKEFHDEFISRGPLPISLIRYEMTGFDDDVSRFWNRTPLSEVLRRSNAAAAVSENRR